ncbi:unnamed protein product [Cochlearia groenlandica]
MGIDAKYVGTLLWKVLRISMNIVYTYVRKYPVVSGVSIVILLLYTFLPRLLCFILYSSPFFACSVFYLRNHPSFKLLKNNTVNGLSPFSQKGSEEGTRKADLEHQRSVRRNARRKVEEVGKDWDSSQASEDERDKVILTTLYGEQFSDTRKSPKFQDFKKDRAFLASQDFSFEPNPEEEASSTAGNVTVLDPSEWLTSGGGDTEIECSSSSEEEQGQKEETTHEDNKIVTWTEDDQKNLMDLGNSETERNKRLEHLITRRRTRRLFLLAAEKSLMDMEVPSICVGRNSSGLDQENHVNDELQMPESAPSVLLLPTKNPFDIPYDPQEEKPNLTGDSFQQEFAAKPSDNFFCHHESFCRRIFPSEIHHPDSNLEQLRKPIDDWPRPQQGTWLYLSENFYSNDMKSENRTNVDESDSKSLLSLGEQELNSDDVNQADSFVISEKRKGDLRAENPLMGIVPRNTGSLSTSLAAERQIYMEHYGYNTRKNHKMTKSVESDLQVEFSEIGSPPTTIDGNISSSDDEEKSIFVDESQTLPVNKFDQDLNETSCVVSQESVAAKELEGVLGGVDVNGGSEEEERSKSRQSLQESPDRGLLVSLETVVPHTNEAMSKREEVI